MMLVLAENGNGVAHTVHVAVGLISIAAAVGVLTKFVRVPYTIALVLTGLAIALSGGATPGVRLTEELVFLLFLPPLLFQAALHTDMEHLRRNWKPVAIMAFPGVLFTALAVGAVAKPVLTEALGAEATWAVALMLGTVLAPTDAISVLAAFKQADAPRRLRAIVEGESLFNDGTAVALFAVLKPAALFAAAGLAGGPAAHSGVTVAGVALEFVREAGLGSVLGLGLGVATLWVLKQLNDHVLETGITIALAWGSFVLAESLHASGVIAVVVAGLIIGNYGTVLSMSEESRRTLTGFWDSTDYIVNSVLFLLVGLEISDPALEGTQRLLDPMVIAGAAVTLAALLAARAAVVYLVAWLFRDDWPRWWKHVVWWAGLRGSLSLALVLGLPRGELRDYLAPVVFLVVLGSLLGQALTMGPLIRWVRKPDAMEDGAEG